jgi:hypothetical protein
MMDAAKIRPIQKRLLEHSDNGWVFEAVSDSKGFATYKNREVAYALWVDDNLEVHVLVNGKDLGVVTSRSTVSHLIWCYMKDTQMSKNVPKVIRGKDYGLCPKLKTMVLKRLHHDLCEVRFVKADDTIRIMLCTLLPTFMPDEDYDGISYETMKKRENNPYLVTVWDVEKMAFRSFTLERFLRLTVI